MKIIFIHLGEKEIAGDTLTKSPLGGTESALIGVARALAKNPENQIHVFANTPAVKVFEAVTYHPIKTLAAWSQTNETDVLISIRQWLPLVLPVRARFRIYFSPDAYNQPALHRAFDIGLDSNGEKLLLPFLDKSFFVPNADAIFCVGQWQANTFVDFLRLPKDKIYATGNAVFLENFTPESLAGRRPAVVYSSTPFRGLVQLLALLPKLRTNFPQLEVDICSGMGVYGASQEEDIRAYGALYEGLKAVGARSHGSIKQKDLADILCRSRVYTYPNTFEETFCIAVLEAQAAGLPVVTSRKGALPERVTDGVDGFLINGHPGDAAYDRDFMAATHRLLTDDTLWQQMSQAAQKKASTQTYDHLAAQWQEYFDSHLNKIHQATLPRDTRVFQLSSIEIPHPTKSDVKIPIDQNSFKMIMAQALDAYGYHVS